MFEIEHIADTKFDELLEHVDLGELDVIGYRLVLGVLSYSFPHVTFGGGFKLNVTMTLFWKNCFGDARELDVIST